MSEPRTLQRIRNTRGTICYSFVTKSCGKRSRSNSKGMLSRVSDTVPAWTSRQLRRRDWYELVIVFGLSLGASAVYSIVALLRRLAATEALNKQTATINKPLASDQIFDLVYQILGIGFALFRSYWRSTFCGNREPIPFEPSVSSFAVRGATWVRGSLLRP